ncbi:hypothetical protein GW17_00026759 [Ensete ventricosum]|uniref:Uncharacterized protein n=1 Tax=Ensete ventricosum TaxID=4639 RepID=A0A444EH50_ENSVE|nr:hypothetical protein GW17_00026759 [Ensete ventricosum]RZR71168.1 hypothetical protein BHM03_00003935 [Ensete ventricosum]
MALLSALSSALPFLHPTRTSSSSLPPCRFHLGPRRSLRRLSSPLLPSPVAFSASALPLGELVERDWSFLDADATNNEEQRADKARRIISAADIRGTGSRVLAALPTLSFVDRVVESAPWELLVAIHESLFVLAMIKESHDRVRCWQGGVDAVPERFSPFDAVFICYFPGMNVSIDQLLSSLAGKSSPGSFLPHFLKHHPTLIKIAVVLVNMQVLSVRCNLRFNLYFTGARVVLSFDQGREVIEQNHRQQYPDMVTNSLPDRAELERAATEHSFQITEFVDEPTFYLAVLRFHD